ncbi:hypothetical protein PI124_g7402 [Phytophthora idaei]|nr:hypothetical protein PI126_g7448 [Phytophthora idaei]KAG3247903.1 hypothetical protein PI124_g7402 [Phytophthora idaei]
MESLRASGTTEDFTEREQLLTDIASLYDEHMQEKSGKTKKERREAERSRVSRSSSRCDGGVASLPFERRGQLDSFNFSIKAPKVNKHRVDRGLSRNEGSRAEQPI